ncbi:MAG: tectonin domain-containing protein [Candidatus Babeliales bacterium]
MNRCFWSKLLMSFFALLITNNFLFSQDSEQKEEGAPVNFEIIKAEYGVFSDKPEIYTNDKVVLLNTKFNKYLSSIGDANYSKNDKWQDDNLTNMIVQKVDNPVDITALKSGGSIFIKSINDSYLYIKAWGLFRDVSFGNEMGTKAQWTIYKKTGGEPRATGENINNGDEVYFKSNFEQTNDRYLYSWFAEKALSDPNWRDQQAVWKISKAVKGEGAIDVTDRVKNFINAGRAFKSSNEFFTDPAPDVAKWLKISYRVSGEEKIKWFFQGTDVKFPELKRAVIPTKIEIVSTEGTVVDIKSAKYGVFDEKPEIWFGDKISLTNKKANKCISRLEGDKVKYAASWQGDIGAALYLRLAANVNKIASIKNKDTVLIESSAKSFLSIGSGWRELIFSGSTGDIAQWILLKRGSGAQDTINDNDEVLIQSKAQPSQYLFTYFNQFPVHDNQPSDEQSIYIIKKSVEGAGFVDVTDKLRDLMTSGKRIKISDVVSDVSDPAVGFTKYLKIEYSFAGKDFTKWINVSVEKTIDLGAPTGFTKVSEPLLEVSLGLTKNGDMDIWGIHALGAIYRWNWTNNTWQEIDSKIVGKAKHIANCKSSGVVFCVNADKNIFKFEEDSWIRVKGKLGKIAVGDSGSIWGILNGAIYKATDPAAPVSDDIVDIKWQSVSLVGAGAKAEEIAVGSDSSVWYLTDKNNLYRREGNSWVLINKKLKKIFVGDSKNVWGIDEANNLVFSSNNGKTWQNKGKNFVSGSADNKNNVWLIASLDIGGGVYTNVDIAKESEKIKQTVGAKTQIGKLQISLEQAKKDNDQDLVQRIQAQIDKLKPALKERQLQDLQKELRKAQKLGDEKKIEEVKRQIQELTGIQVKSEIEKLKEEYNLERAKPDYNVDKLLRLKKQIAKLEGDRETVFDSKLKSALDQTAYQNKISSLEAIIQTAGVSPERRKKYIDALQGLLSATAPENLGYLNTLFEKVKTDTNFAQDETVKDSLDSMSENIARSIKIAKLERDAQKAKLIGETETAKKVEEQIKKLKERMPTGELERLRDKLSKEATKSEPNLKKMKELRAKIDELQGKEDKQTTQTFQSEVDKAKNITAFNEKIEKFKELLSLAAKTEETRDIYVEALAEIVAFRTGDQLEKLQELLKMAMYNETLINNNAERKTILSELYASSQTTVTRLEVIKDLKMLLDQETFTPEQKELFIKEVNSLFDDAVVMAQEELDAFIDFLNVAMKSPHFVAQKEDAQKMLDALQGKVSVAELIDLLNQRFVQKSDVKTEYHKQSFINALRYLADQIINSKKQGISVGEAENNFIDLLTKVKNDYSYPLTSEQRKQIENISKDVTTAIIVKEPTKESGFAEKLDYLYKLVTKDTFITPDNINSYMGKLADLITQVDAAGDIEKNKFADMLNFMQYIKNISEVQKTILKRYYNRIVTPKSLEDRVKKLILQATAAIESSERAAKFIIKLQENLNEIVAKINEGKAPEGLPQLITTLKTIKNTSAFSLQKNQLDAILAAIEKKQPEVKKEIEKKKAEETKKEEEQKRPVKLRKRR